MSEPTLQANLDAEIIPVEIHHGEELYYATSPELPELLVIETNREALAEAIPRVVKLLYKARDRHVEVLHAKSDSVHPGQDTWVAVPCDAEGYLTA